jgi:outer membrane lipoprotein-sorting protein
MFIPMKKIKILMIALSATFTLPIVAQPLALQEFSKKMNAIKSFSVKFTYLLQNKTNIESQENGSLIVNGAKYRLDMTNSLIVCDNVQRYTYLKKENEIIIETPNPLRDGIFANPNAIFSINFKDFNIKESGANAEEISFDLIPKQSGQTYHKITLALNKSTYSLAKIVYYSTDERTTILIINDFKPNVSAANTDFVFDIKQYPQAEVIDMR